MDVLFISRRYYPEVKGGGELSALQIARNISSLGHNVTVFTLSDTMTEKAIIPEGDIKLYIDRVKYVPSKFTTYSNLDRLWKFTAKHAVDAVGRYQPDVIHISNFESIPYTVQAIKKKYPKIPIYATVNGPNFGCFTNDGIDYQGKPCLDCHGMKRVKNCLHKWGAKGLLYYIYSLHYMPLLKRSYKAIDGFFCVSHAIAEMLKTMDVPDEKIHIIHNPMRPNTKDVVRPAPEGHYVIGYVGRLQKDKGVHRIIEAMVQLPNVYAIIAGRGPEEKSLKELAAHLKVDDRIRFAGFVEPAKIRSIYSHIDIAILPCTVYESLSRMLLEACSFGIPVIATDVGGNSEIVENDKNGVLLKTHTTSELIDAIRYVHYHRDEMGKNAREKILREFNPTAIALAMENQYARTPWHT